jgi:hypothetical protein
MARRLNAEISIVRERIVDGIARDLIEKSRVNREHKVKPSMVATGKSEAVEQLVVVEVLVRRTNLKHFLGKFDLLTFTYEHSKLNG